MSGRFGSVSVSVSVSVSKGEEAEAHGSGRGFLVREPGAPGAGAESEQARGFAGEPGKSGQP